MRSDFHIFSQEIYACMYAKHMYRQTLEHVFGSPTSPFEAVKGLYSNTFNAQVYDYTDAIIIAISQAAH